MRASWAVTVLSDFAAILLISPLFPFASFRAHDFD